MFSHWLRTRDMPFDPPALVLATALSVIPLLAACGGGSSASPDSVPPSATATLTSGSLVQGNLQRSYLKYLPARALANPAPLVIVLHGGSEDAATAASTRRATYAWRELADTEGFVLVYPDGVSGRWRDCRSDATVRSNADDVAFIDALITRISSEHVVDPRRVYVTGASNGGMMSYRIAQELAGRIAGVGAVIANLPMDPGGTCAQSNLPMTAVIMNGTADALMPFLGGVVALSPSNGTVLSDADTRSTWLRRNGCAGTPSTTTVDLDPNDGISVTRMAYSNCAGGTELVFFRVDGGGHIMPSLRYGEGSSRQSRDIEGAAEIWRVLKNARR